MIKLIAVGKMKNKSLAELAADYAKRISKFDKLEISEIKDSTLPKEAEKILEKIKSSKAKIYVLSEEGRTVPSAKLAKMLEADLAETGASAFVIGSACGMHESVKKSADMLLSISPMTFTHEWARAIILEQIYRAKTISANTPYHRA
ncbi:MAG: 23S rRNA (pseudouridine(1915)-N(3))-methyltransferase RlmH [Opitutales bacterium]|nr:23S rRNA (pseudouridine(1915)-N(3))-methyltransferase RlmH [Opitutales bacterium]